MKNLPKFAPKFTPKFTWLAAIAALLVSPDAMAQSRAQYESMVATHAAANNVPVALVHRVIVRESKYHPGLVGRGGTIGLMQIKLATARGLGYTGDAAGLRDPDTNLAWGIKYLAGAYRAATATTAAPCVIMRAAIITLQSASGTNSPRRSRRCSRVMRRQKSSRRRPKRQKQPQTRTRNRFPRNDRHGRACPGHPPSRFAAPKAWMPGMSPGTRGGHDEGALLTPPSNRLH